MSKLQFPLVKPLEKSKLQCQLDKSPLDCKCPADLKVNPGKKAKIYHSANSLYWHLVQCPNYTKITRPTRSESIKMLENLTIANSYGMIS